MTVRQRERVIHQSALTCPSCKSRNELATSPFGPEPPSEGDAGLCITCGEFMIFDGLSEGRARLPTSDEAAELKADPMAAEMQRRWRQMVSP